LRVTHKTPVAGIDRESNAPDGSIGAAPKLNETEHRQLVLHGESPRAMRAPTDVTTSSSAHKVTPLQRCCLQEEAFTSAFMAPSKHEAIQRRHGLFGAFETATVRHTGETHRGEEPEPGSKLLLQGEKLNLDCAENSRWRTRGRVLQAGIDLFEPLAQVSTQASSTQLHLLHAPESLSRYLEPSQIFLRAASPRPVGPSGAELNGEKG